MEDNKQQYDASNIQVLEGLEAVRKRPGMYIGSTSGRGLHHLVWEIVDNAIDEALAGYCDDIEVIINKDNSITVKDDGRGIPTGVHAKTGLSTVETVYTVLHAGGKFGGGGYKVSGGLHGVGASVVNALSEWVEVKVYQNGKVHFIRFEDGGKTVEPLKIIEECDINRTGTTVTFKPDATIFTETQVYEYDILKNRIKELAFLNKGLKIILIDDREVEIKKEEFIYEGGISAYVEMLNANKTVIHEKVVYFEGEKDNIALEIAMQYNSGFAQNIYSFTNNINTHEGGTHEDGVKVALTRIVNSYGRTNNIIKEKDENLSGEDVREGLTMIVSCKHPNPQFEGQTKTKLGNAEVRKIASDVVSEGLERFLLENPTVARTIVEKAMTAARARVAAKRARELIRKKSDNDFTADWGKLAKCSSKIPEECELFIVEGDSAAGAAKQGRDAITQAILPLRGKILNVEKARLDKILGNAEIRSLITALGTGIGEEFSLENCRYHKIVIMTDADVDGSHIRTLLLTLLYRFFKPVISAGYVYAAQPPLFKVTHGKTVKYFLTEQEKNEYLTQFDENQRKPQVARMKGLGEMDKDELSETTMHIENRVLRKVTLEDAMVADEIFEILMGEAVEPRRNFIEENALNVENLDI